MKKTDSVCLGVIGAEGVGAHELRQAFAFVGGRRRRRPHLMKDDGLAGLSDLPGGFGAGETTADDMKRARGGRGLNHAAVVGAATSAVKLLPPVLMSRTAKACPFLTLGFLATRGGMAFRKMG
ncbi:hypothetical protein CHELA20_51671 [Hyphomicrobiales bacterium]|nr:hypothetical protein CHELA41_23341 [Hyphomicrobiales bacterium]CAH1677681.1 hypothetical protein CHELA20_51671 [Hyphomicrobiales bacterium]